MTSLRFCRTAACVALLAFVASPALAQKRGITETDLLRFIWVADPQISPDGAHVVFVRVAADEKKDQYDTSLWIAVERGAVGAADIHAITRQEPVYLSPVNIAEIRFGLELLRPGRQKQRAAAALRRLRRKPQLRITVEMAEAFGILAAKLRKTGRDPHVRIDDLWLAAQAIQRAVVRVALSPPR